MSIQRRNVRSQTPSNRAASSCISRLSVQGSLASSKRPIRVYCNHDVRLIRYFLPHPMRTGQTLCYKTGRLCGLYRFRIGR